ncbi:hypothetical protein ACXZ3F_004195 [Escherichia coli]
MRLMESPIKNARRQPSVLNKSRWNSEGITGSIHRSHYDKYSKNTQLRQRYLTNLYFKIREDRRKAARGE